MTPRQTYLLLAAIVLAALAGGVAALRLLASAPGTASPRLPAVAAKARPIPAPVPQNLNALALGLRRGAPAAPAPEATAPEPPAVVAALAPEAPLSEKPLPDVAVEEKPDVEGAISFPESPARPSAPGAPPPTPPLRPGDLGGLAAPPATPLPPPRPQNLAALTPEPATAPAESAPAAAPGAPEPPAAAPPAQVARAPEPALRPAPDDAFQPAAPVRFGMGDPVFVRIFKQEGQLELWLKKNGRFSLYKTFPICKWSGRLGPKVREADYQSPEGFYSVSARQLHPHSNYHRAFNVGYPNAFDKQNGRTGGLVMVHGNCKSVGCFAMTDRGIEEIYGFVEAALRAGQKEVPVHIFPFRMTDHAIARETGGGWMAFVGGGNFQQWAGFWKNLKEGYDLFESTGEPPVAYACGDHYRFGASEASCRRIAGW